MSVVRVNKQNKCPICEHDSWCLLGSDAAICMRVAGGKEHTFRDGSIGWIHQLKSATFRPYVARQPNPVINAAAIMEEWRRRSKVSLYYLATKLGVTEQSLEQLGCTWSGEHNAYAFPMFNGGGNCVGIRLRHINGEKWAVKGSRQGLFMSNGPTPNRVVVCEGPTDAAAALTIGMFPIGRPHCSGGVEDIKEFCKRRCVTELVIISDNDEPGLRGASVLSEAVPVSNCILVMPAKDMRSFVNAGGDQETFTSLLGSVVWNRKEK